jgi:Flp pilus assembly protein CpaB
MLRPGDHVDVLGTFARGQGTDWATVTLLQNVQVLATGELRAAAEGESDTSSQPKSFNNITLSVDLEEAELLAFSVQRGPINVILRAQDDLETVEDIPDKNFGDIFEVQKRAAFRSRHSQKKIEVLKSQ